MKSFKKLIQHMLKPWILLPILFGVFMLAFFPFRFVFEFDPDEGLNVMKSLLQLRGYRLYAEIYSDQPPLFTLLLTVLFLFLGPNVTLARVLVLVFSLLLLGAAIWYLRSCWGLWHAILGFALLILIHRYSQLSVSIMIGLPAIALALLSFALAASWFETGNPSALTLSAIVMAAAVLVKAIVAPLGLCLGLAILGKGIVGSGNRAAGVRPALIWGVTSLALLLIGGLLIGPQNWHQLVASHLQSDEIPRFISRAEDKDINFYLSESWGLVILGLLGAGYVGWKREWAGATLAGWGLLNYALLTQVTPVWYHHQLLVAVPAAILGAIPAGDALSNIARSNANRQRAGKGVLAGLAVLALVVWFHASATVTLFEQIEFRWPNVVRGPEPESLDFIHLARMSELRGEDEVIVTDRPMFAFRMGKIVPPELAVWSRKRLEIGSITEADVIREIERWEPTQVLIGRYILPEVEEYLAQDYTRAYHYGDFRLFERISN